MTEIKGSHFIADEVIAAIAINAAQEIDNITIVTGIAEGFVEKFGRKQTRGIRVEQDEEGLKLEMKIIVDYGINIPEICGKVQDIIIKQVENLTGLKVISIDINVSGINTQSAALDTES